MSEVNPFDSKDLSTMYEWDVELIAYTDDVKQISRFLLYFSVTAENIDGVTLTY